MKKCKWCMKEVIFDKDISLEALQKWDRERIDDHNGLPLTNKTNNNYTLTKCNSCNTFWEIRPDFENQMYGGSPETYVKVTEEYVKEHYPGVIED